MERRPPRYLLVGKIGRAVGLRGEVEVLVASDDPARLAVGSVLNVSGDRRRLTVRSVRRRGGRTVVAFEEVRDRVGAEALRGEELVVSVERARVLEPGEFWEHELVGTVVRTTAGADVGRVADVLRLPAGEVLVVDSPDGEKLVPLVRTIVVAVDVHARVVTIDPMPGLLDPSDEG